MKENKNKILSWVNPKIETRDVKDFGKGMFSKEEITKNEKLAIFGGYVMTVSEEESLEAPMSDYGLQIDDEYVLGVKNKDEIEPACFFNHNCNPNAGFKGQIFLVALKNIKAEEEIVFDYAMVLGGDEPYKLKCLCKSPHCRKIITNNDWKLPELQQKYDGYFQLYLQEKINKLKKKD